VPTRVRGSLRPRAGQAFAPSCRALRRNTAIANAASAHNAPFAAMAVVMPLRTAPGSPPSVLIRAITRADITGVPIVMPIYWLIVASPVARPCSVSGRPEVAVTMNPTIATRLATPPTNVAATTRTIQPESFPSKAVATSRPTGRGVRRQWHVWRPVCRSPSVRSGLRLLCPHRGRRTKDLLPEANSPTLSADRASARTPMTFLWRKPTVRRHFPRQRSCG